MDGQPLPHDVASAEDIEAALTERLVECGKLTVSGLERARRQRTENPDRMHVLLVKLGLAADSDVAQALSDVMALPLAGQDDYPAEPVCAEAIGMPFLRTARAVPLAETPDSVTLAMADPLDEFTAKAVAIATQRQVLRRVGVPMDIDSALERLYGRGAEAHGASPDGLPDAGVEISEQDAERLKDMASEAPVIRLVNQLISQAVSERASDIHVEPFEGVLRVRIRTDGVLRTVAPPPGHLSAAIASRIKIMANLNIAERRLPQDGRVKLAVHGRTVDLRVSTLPTLYGESIVLRILDKGSMAFDFATLGLDDATLQTFKGLLNTPNGILLVTGPTGSGKTTTLYTSLLTLNTPDKKILTVEDPVEYQLEGVNQVHVKPQIGLTFANVLRSMLRQDPDIVMIGEIRDLETAEIAAQAALTGHLVLSTLHTNSAAGTVTRLLDMGLEDYLLASTVIGITAQRLVRTLCPECRRPHPDSRTLAEHHGLERFAGEGPVQVFRAVGCAKCNETGYWGRACISELLVMDDEMRRMTLHRADAREIHRQAVELGMRPLYEDGLRKVAQGVTTLEEVLRVTRES